MTGFAGEQVAARTVRGPRKDQPRTDQPRKDRLTKIRLTKIRLTKHRLTKHRVTKHRVTKDRVAKDRAAHTKGRGVVAAVATISALLWIAQLPLPAASAAGSVWHVSRAPKLRVDVVTGCPGSVTAFQDVVNTFPGPPLVPAHPKAGLICRYGPSTAKPGPVKLERQTRLDLAQADLLATVVRQLSLAPPTGVSHCPADFGLVAVVGLSFAGRPDVGLWYDASGCQTLDNGRIGAFEGGNPSFYNGFLSVVDRLSPPVGQ
jgi:hypothetical protein